MFSRHWLWFSRLRQTMVIFFKNLDFFLPQVQTYHCSLSWKSSLTILKVPEPLLLIAPNMDLFGSAKCFLWATLEVPSSSLGQEQPEQLGDGAKLQLACILECVCESGQIWFILIAFLWYLGCDLGLTVLDIGSHWTLLVVWLKFPHSNFPYFLK